MSRRGGGSKFITGLICFLLGFIMAFAAIAGVVCMGLFADFDTIFGIVNVDNTDEDGNYVYVNTDEVSNVYSLISALVSYVGDYSNMTLGDLENLLPATSVITDSIVELAVEYINEDSETLREGLTTTKLSELGDYVSDLVNSIEVASLLELLAPDLFGDDAAGVLITAIAYGKQAEYVTTASGDLPVYYDVYKYVSGTGYVRYTADEDGEYTVMDTTAGIPEGNAYCDYLVPVYSDDGGSASAVSYKLTSGGTSQTVDYYYLYYYLSGDTAYLTDGDYTYESPSVEYVYYSEDAATLTGNYYVDANGDKVVITAVTLGDMTDSSFITESLNYVSITDLISGDGDDSISTILGDYTIGDLLNGDIDFNTIELSSLLSTSPSNTVMAVILYDGISGITETANGWTCNYTDGDGNVYPCTINLDGDGNISSIVYTDGDGNEAEVPATTVGGISELMDDLELVVIMDPVSPDDDLMMYIFYGVTGVSYSSTDGWTASYKLEDGTTVTAYIETSGSGDDETVDTVYYLDGEGNKISTATTINGVNDVINNLQDEFEIAALMGDVEADDAIMVYISYKITGVYQDSATGNWYGYITENDVKTLVELSVEEDTNDEGETVTYVTGATYAEGENYGTAVSGTTINGISDVVSGLQSELEIASLLGDIYTDDDILIYLAYSVTGVYYDSATDSWHGTYNTRDGDNKTTCTVDIAVEADGDKYLIKSVTYNGVPVEGTTIESVSDVISNLQEDMELATFLDEITTEDDILIYVAYSVSGVYQKDGTWYGTYNVRVTDEENNITKKTYPATFEVETNASGEYVITSVTYINDAGETLTVPGTTISGISDVIKYLQEDMELATFLGNIYTEDDILIYVAYSVTGVYQDSTTGNWYGTYNYRDENGVKHTYTVDITVEEDSGKYLITSITYNGEAVAGTTISGVSDVISNLQEDMELVTFIGDITTDDDILIYVAYSVSGVYYDSTDGKWYGTYNYRDENGTKTTYKATLTVNAVTDENSGKTVYYVTGVTYTTDGTDTLTVDGTTISGISDVISNLQKDMEISAFIGDITTDDDILIYVAYSITGVYYDSTTYTWYGTYNYRGDDGTKTTYVATLSVEKYPDDESSYLVTGAYYTYTDGEGVEQTVTISGTTIDGIGDVISNLQDDMEIAALIGDIKVEDNAILIYLTYSISGVYYDSTDGKWYGYVGDDKVNISVDASGNITGATYDSNGSRVAGTTVSGISDQIDGIMETLTLGELITIDESNTFLKSLQNSTINSLSNDINSLSIQEVYYDSIYVTYKKVVESEVTDTSTQIAFSSTDTFYTYDNTSNSYVLLSFSGSSYSELMTASNGAACYVKVEEAVRKQAVSNYSESDYAEKIAFNEDYLYYYIDEDGDYTLVDYDKSGSYLGKLTSDQFSNLEYSVYTYGEVSGTWKLMLYSDDDTTYTGEVAYSINKITDLMGNVTANLGTATLNDLKEMGVISTSSTTLNTSISGYNGKSTLGDLTISETIDYVAYVMGGGQE